MPNKTEPLTNEAAHQNWWRTFEMVLGIPLFAALILELFVPLSIPLGFLSTALTPVGIALIIIGLVLIFLARRDFERHNQPTDPGRPTQRLVTTGAFSVSRNPLYLGGVCVVGGIAFVFNLDWVLIFLVPSLMACHYILIAPEERYLAAKFGRRYRRYTAKVYRWFGRKIKME